MVKFYDWGTGGFSNDELDRLERYCDGLPLTKGGFNNAVPGGQSDSAIRVTDIAMIYQAPDIMWFFERLAGLVRSFNEHSFHYDVRGFFEAPQFLVYHGSEAGHYDWHMDIGPTPPRKLSLTIQLTDPARYEGCELQFNAGTSTISTPKERGVVVVFPSYMLHRVTPITAGVRKAIVAWVTGPEFK